VADAVFLVTRANELARDGMPLAARDLYERVIDDYPEHPVRAGALFGLGQLHADASSPLRDYRVAYLTFGRVLVEHPRSRWESDTRLWRGVLNELLTRDEEAHRLRVQLQKLRRIEVDLDKAR
jgi:TolA-binding protein